MNNSRICHNNIFIGKKYNYNHPICFGSQTYIGLYKGILSLLTLGYLESVVP